MKYQIFKQTLSIILASAMIMSSSVFTMAEDILPLSEEDCSVEEEAVNGNDNDPDVDSLTGPYDGDTQVTYDRLDTNADWQSITVTSTVWDCIWFGNYWQDDTNKNGKADKNDEKQPIKWRILDINSDKKALLLADYVLDVQPYNSSGTSTKWADCSLRTWLNNEFYDNAFNMQEKSAIKTSMLENHSSKFYFTEGGAATQDEVFLLTWNDCLDSSYGFDDYCDETWDYCNADDPGRITAPTAFAKENKYDGYWWLRTPGNDNNHAATSGGGTLNGYGKEVGLAGIGVRPALVIKLKEAAWTYAGTVCNDGTVKEKNSVITPDNPDNPDNDLILRVPFTEKGQIYPSASDNFAPVSSSGKIKDLKVDFANVSKSDVKPSDLKMTVLKGTTIYTKDKVADPDKVTTTGGIKAKVNKKTMIAAIKPKSNGRVTLAMADGTTYTICFTVEQPKAQKRAKTINIDDKYTKVLTLKDMFNTTLDGGELIISSQKAGNQAVLDSKNKTITIKPKDSDKIKILYKYLDKKYKLTISVK